jgi:hypothetical protein
MEAGVCVKPSGLMPMGVPADKAADSGHKPLVVLQGRMQGCWP